MCCVVTKLTIAELVLLSFIGVAAAKVNIRLPFLVSCVLEVFVIFQSEQEVQKVLFVYSLVPRRRIRTHGLSPGSAYRHHFNGVVEVQPT